MDRILCIVGSMNAGGAETFMMKVLRQMDRKKTIIDFAVASKEKGFYDSEIEELGGIVYHIVPKTKGVFRFFKSIYHVIKNNKYRKVLRISQNATSVIELIVAKMAGAKVLAFRSSNSDVCGGFFEKMGHFLFKPLAILVPNVKIAPSKNAAVFMFGKGNTKKGKVNILKNGINVDTYKYSFANRQSIRKELGISDETFVVGHIGRFNYQKNHEFLIKVFSEICKKKNNTKLLLVGMGEKEEEVRKAVNNFGLIDKVIFAGVRKDIPNILSAMDFFVLPSLFEGMPNTVIEAQASGLNCLISDTITKDVRLNSLVEFASLGDGPGKWAEIINSTKLNASRENAALDVANMGYDIATVEKAFSQLMCVES